MQRCGLLTLIARAILFGVAVVVASAEGQPVGGFALRLTEDRGFFDYSVEPDEWSRPR